MGTEYIPAGDVDNPHPGSALYKLIQLNGGRRPAKSPEINKLAAEAVAFQKNLVLTEEDINEIIKKLAKDVAELDD